MKYKRRSPAEEREFRELAALCGLRMDKVGKRQRRGYRVNVPHTKSIPVNPKNKSLQYA